MSNFTLTRDDFVKLGRVEEWDQYEDENERILHFYADGVRLTFHELSIIARKKEYYAIRDENKVKYNYKSCSVDKKYEFDQREYVEYYPPKKNVEKAIKVFCDNLVKLIDKIADNKEIVHMKYG